MNNAAGDYIIPYHTAFVVNPRAGDGKAGRIWPKIEYALKQTGQSYRAYFTCKANEGAGLAARALFDGAELVVAVGGDGTLREVVNGIDLKKNYFGAIPAGTGNGFARSCGIPLHWREALQGLALWKPRSIDTGTVNGTYFLNVVGLGFDAAVARSAAAKYHRYRGYLAYIAAFIEQAGSLNRFNCKTSCDGFSIEDSRILLALVANGTHYANKVCIAPRASLDDGLFDLFLIRKGSIPELTAVALKAIFKKHMESRGIIKARGRNIRIETDQKVPVHVDGDVFEHSAVEICMEPRSLKILSPLPIDSPVRSGYNNKAGVKYASVAEWQTR